MTNTETVGDVEIDTRLFESLDSQIPCSYNGCDVEAAHILVCGVCYQGREFMCAPHTEQTVLLRSKMPEFQVIFDQTCHHSPELGNCEIQPITV